MTEMVSVLSGKTVSEVEAMTIPDFNKLAKEISEELKKPLPEGKPLKHIKGHAINYEPAKLSRGQYITVQHFIKGDIIDNAHLILASLTYNEKTKKHEADKHSKIAEELQGAELTDVLPSCVFFCNLFAASIRSLENYLLKDLLSKGMRPEIALQQMTTLMNGLDGYTMLSRSQTLKESA